MIYWKYNLGLYDLSQADLRMLPILSKGRPGPPEIIGGHEPTGFYAMGVKFHGAAKAIILPENIGRLYYLQGYQEHKNILLDVIDYAFPQADSMIQTNAPARVEAVLQEYALNLPGHPRLSDGKPAEGLMLHLVNITGFSGNTYFDPLPVSGLQFHIACPFRPSRVSRLTDDGLLAFSWKDGWLDFQLPELKEYEAVIIRRYY